MDGTRSIVAYSFAAAPRPWVFAEVRMGIASVRENQMVQRERHRLEKGVNVPCISGAMSAREKEPMRIAMNTLIIWPASAWLSLMSLVPKEKAEDLSQAVRAESHGIVMIKNAPRP